MPDHPDFKFEADGARGRLTLEGDWTIHTIRDVSEALTSPEVARRELITYAEHSSAGRIAQVRSPMLLSRTPVVAPTAAPLLGEHTAEVLRDLLGRDAETVARLRQTGTIR